MKKLIISVLFLFTFVYSQHASAKGVEVTNTLSNTVEVFAINYYMTNYSLTNLFVAEIHGIMSITSNNTNIVISPGNGHTFWSSISNAANITETDLVLILTNYQTNAGLRTGDWQVSVLDVTNNTTNVIYTMNSYALSASVVLTPSAGISPDVLYHYAIRLDSSVLAVDGSWASVKLHLRAQTNVSRYMNDLGDWFGGKTNVVNMAKADIVIFSPLVTLSKSITLITNVAYANNSLIPGCDIYYRIRFTNVNGVACRNINIRDVLPSKDVSLSNGFTCTGFATNLIRKFSRKSESTFTYTPVLWDTNVDQILFSATNTFGPGAVGTINYKVRIK